MAGGRWRRYVHGVLLAGRVGLRSGCRRLSPWGSREFGQRPFRWVCHRGRPDVTPARSHGGDPQQTVSRAGSCPCLAPRTVDDTRAICPQGFHPLGARQRAASGARKGVRVRARPGRLGSHMLMVSRYAGGVPGLHSGPCGGITGLHSGSSKCVARVVLGFGASSRGHFWASVLVPFGA